jgi:hypothetical protein
MGTETMLQHHGLNVGRTPLAQDATRGGPPEQGQNWPGSHSGMHPAANHRERTYRGGNKLADLKALVTGGDSGIEHAVAIAFARVSWP